MGIEFTDLENQVQERLQSLLEKMDTSFAAAAGTSQESISIPASFKQSSKNCVRALSKPSNGWHAKG
jgi:hypothetical protein